MKKQLILFSFVFLLVISSFVVAEEVQQEITLIKTQQNMQQSIDENSRTVSYVFKEQGAIKIGDSNYWDAREGSLLKTDDKGNLIEANLTAVKETTWKFGNDSITVEPGTRVFYREGKIEIFDNKNKKVDVELGENAEFKLKEGVLSGKNFQVGDIKLQQGSLSIINGGYVLGENSLADWKGLTLGNEKDLFLATSEKAYSSYEGSAIFPENLRLRGKGEGYDILFTEGNKWAKIQKGDLFLMKTTSQNTNFDLQNRESNGLIPKMDLIGDLEVVEDSKTFLIENNRISIKKGGVGFNPYDYFKQEQLKLIGEDTLWDTKFPESEGLSIFSSLFTTPLDIQVDDKTLKISNFNQFQFGKSGEKGVIIDSLGESKSIYWNGISDTLNYNYPSFNILTEKFKGIPVAWVDFEKTKVPQSLKETYEQLYSRAILDAFESSEKIDAISKINIGWISGGGDARYNPEDYSIDFRLTPLKQLSKNDGSLFSIVRHELVHAQHDFISGKEGTTLSRGGEDVLKYYALLKSNTEEENLKNPQYVEWDKKFSAHFPFSPGSELTSSWQEMVKDVPYEGKTTLFSYSNNEKAFEKGWIRGYAGSNLNEDVATFVQKIVEDPAFFQRNNLLNQDSNPLFRQKIEILYNSGFISDKEYDAVFHPEKYGLE